MIDAKAHFRLSADLPAGQFIGNALVQGRSGRTLTHVNPSTGIEHKSVALASDEDVDAAVASSLVAFGDWRRTAPAERRRVLQAIATALRDHSEELARIHAVEVGTPLGFGRWMVADAADWFDYYAGWTDKLVGDTIPIAHDQGLNYTLLEPVGVVAKVLTWNNPLGGISMSIAAALAAGCTAVIKPAEQAPFAALRFAELAAEAGLPKGVVNVLIGDAAASRRLVGHKDIAKISFTGGPVTARKLQQIAAENLTPLILELGGKSANVVFADADLEAAVEFATAISALSGQGCSLPSRLLVERSVYDEVVGRVVERLRDLKVGDPLEPGIVMGPVIDATARDRILSMITASVASGQATCALGGQAIRGSGFFVAPTVLRDVDPDSPIAQQEVFGPVLAATPFDSEEDAVRLANGTSYALAAYIHTTRLDRALRLARDLRAGGIGINGKMLPATYATPFGGSGLSGYGREGGREGVEEFLHVKTVAIKF
jgi:aldehyde dehydrogenase (NAD+)